MRQLVLLYWGCVFLMYLSQVYYPTGSQLERYSSRSFLRSRSDVFMIAVIFWLTCFSFLRESYNDSPLSSKIQKNNCRQRHPGFGRRFFNCIQGFRLLAAA